MMNFEFLPNEIFLDLLQVFSGLNSCFNFKSNSKRTFDLPTLADRVTTLTLSDGKETPEQINRFFSYIPSLSQFTPLRSQTICNLRSYETTLIVIHQCYNLYNLTHLKFHFYYTPDERVDLQLFLNNIWDSPSIPFQKRLSYLHTPKKI
jgi:hypothetical protein